VSVVRATVPEYTNAIEEKILSINAQAASHLIK